MGAGGRLWKTRADPGAPSGAQAGLGPSPAKQRFVPFVVRLELPFAPAPPPGVQRPGRCRGFRPVIAVPQSSGPGLAPLRMSEVLTICLVRV